MAISRKLFFSFLALTCIILLATLSLARWSFNQGFLNYFQALEQRRLENLSLDLAEAYVAADYSWQGINSRSFDRIIQNYSRSHNVQQLPNRQDPNRTAPQPLNGQSAPFPRLSDPAGNSAERQLPRVPINIQPTTLPPPNLPPASVYDVDDKLIVGMALDRRAEGLVEAPIRVEGELVGSIKSIGPVRLDYDLAKAFSRQQLWTSLLIGVFSLALALGLSLWLAKLFLTPIQIIMTAISRLSDGNYSDRLDDQRKDEFGNMMRNIDHLANTLDKNRSSRNRWLADISHELRTPLTILTGEIEMMQEGLKPLDMDRLKSLQQETDRMRHIVDDLYQLSLSDIGGLRYNLEIIDISEPIQTAAMACQSRFDEKGLQFELHSDVVAKTRADKKRLEQLFINLLTNASAYTDKPGKVVLKVFVEQQDIVIQLDDSAPSVQADECELLLEPLYRTDASRTRRGEGAGLGLTICKNIVDAHHGQIGLSPSTLGGLQVVVKLKLEEKTYE
ncbi:ATP-binding protein [Reinekea thalattae]|uniref:histidine kinase n=1 Tax=Reinekea thalattae TaxID=2593301 RepID=A0A5C8Z2Z5_9GAMM|nr:ATP-binding protein [Reinekea thalattae]TXR51927.1 HAMP domain-containing protein [Reinekea thalattae]